MPQEKCNKGSSRSRRCDGRDRVGGCGTPLCAGLVALFSCLTIETRLMMDYRPVGMIITAPTEYITTQDNILQINFL